MTDPRRSAVPESTPDPTPPPAPTPAPKLARASESGDPAVHQVMAELQTARMNDDADRAAALVVQLADLGYE
jgi:hypothetical protein